MAATAGIALAQLGSGIAQGEAAKAEGEFQQQQYEINARFSDLKAKESIRMGDKAAAKHGKSIKSLVGRQRASLAAQGVSVDTGTAAEIQEDTLEIGRSEMETIRNNAWRESFGFKQSALSDRLSGEMARMAGDFRATNLLVSGALEAAGTLSSKIPTSDEESSFDTDIGIDEEKLRSGKGDAAVVYDPAKYGGIA